MAAQVFLFVKNNIAPTDREMGDGAEYCVGAAYRALSVVHDTMVAPITSLALETIQIIDLLYVLSL